jgi:hypothetical protein
VLDERGVEDAAGEAVADQGQLQVGAHGGLRRVGEPKRRTWLRARQN